jgi:hypothetical protein
MNVGGGLLHTARTLGEHVVQVNACLSGHQRDSARSRRFVEAFIRPQGVVTPATPVFVDAVEALASAEPGPAEAGRYVLRALLWPAAAIAGRDAAQWLVASERDRAIAARHQARRAREAELRRDKAARKTEQRREKEARAEARRQHQAKRVAEWRRAKLTNRGLRP